MQDCGYKKAPKRVWDSGKLILKPKLVLLNTKTRYLTPNTAYAILYRKNQEPISIYKVAEDQYIANEGKTSCFVQEY